MSDDPGPVHTPHAATDERQDRAAQSGEILQHLSHDIRSAMSDVLGGLRLVDNYRLEPQALTQIDRVRAAAETLAALVDDILLTATGDALVGRFDDGLDLEDWLRALARRWAGRAAERGREFTLVRDGKLPNRLRMQAVELDRIVGNLVSNALVHVPHGEVRVIVSGAGAGAGAGAGLEASDVEGSGTGAGDGRDTGEGQGTAGIRILVEDDGPGFPADILDSTGLPGHATPPTSEGGSGLGLQIAYDLSADLGARLILGSVGADGGGARATLELPPDLADWAGAAPDPSPVPDLSDLRILVAEDNLTNQAILRQMLDALRADVTMVSDGMAALEALRAERFDIALLDIEMPRMSGLEVMEQVRAEGGAAAGTPLVAITAYVLRENREAIYAAGADGIIGKPVASTAGFGHAILRHIGSVSRTPDLQEALWGAGLVRKMDIGRLDRLLEAAGEDGRAELLLRLDQDLTRILEVLERSVAEGDAPEIRSQTHILIAISGAVGAERLCQLAEVLNIAAKRRETSQLGALFSPLRGDLLDLLAVIGSLGR